MKKYYIVPRLYTHILFQTGSIMDLSTEGFDLGFGDNGNNGDAGGAAARDFNIWNAWGTDDEED